MAAQVMEDQLVRAAKTVETFVDAEIERLDNLDIDDLSAIRKQRLAEMKKLAKDKEEWIAQGHGEYTELTEEKEFFEVAKKSTNVVCHFYRDDFDRCKIVDKHLNILARKHLEAKFVKLNAEKSPFLAERLRIKVLPTIALVRDAKTKDFVVGFTDLGGRDDFSTEMLEWRLAQAAVIDYQGDLLSPPDAASAKKPAANKKTKTIRGRQDDSDSDENDW